MQRFSLEGKSALVIGASNPIGRAIAVALAEAGADVGVATTTTNPDETVLVNSCANEIWALDRKHFAHTIHGGDEADVEVVIHRTVSELGRIDILVNAHDLPFAKPTLETDYAEWHAVINANLGGVFLASKYAAREMLKHKWGRIINVASVHGLVASSEKSAYVAAKHALVGLTKVTALENATSGVTCNAICPGWVLTQLVQKQIDARVAAGAASNADAVKQLLAEKEPSLQFTTPEELGALAVFFCSPAGNNVRGVAWNMDGGWAAQ